MIHLAAALCTVEQPGEDTHITHLGRTAAGFADILDNNKYAFLDDRGLCVLKDYPIRRIVPELLFALVGLFRCLEVYRVIGASCTCEYLYPSSSNLRNMIYNSLDMIFMVIYMSISAH